MKKTLITFLLMCGAVQAQTKWLGTLDGNYTYTDNGAGTVWVGFGGVTPSSILEFEWLFETLANDTSGNGYDGTIIGATRNIATNGMSANYDLANSTNSISATMGNVVQSLAWWGNTNGTWRYYEWIGGTQRVNNAAEAYTTNEWFEIDGNDFAFTGSDFDVAQARGYNEVIANEVGMTNRTELGGNLGVIPVYLSSGDTNAFWQSTTLCLACKNTKQDGGLNEYPSKTSSSPTATTNGLNFNGGANHVEFEDNAIATVLTTNWTITSWIRVESDGGGGFGRLFSNRGSAGWYGFTQNDPGGKFEMAIDNNSIPTFVGGDTLLLNEWYHFAFQVEGDGASGVIRMFTNGVLYAATTNITAETGDADLYIGNNPAGSRGYDGDLGSFTIYNEVRTAQQLLDEYNEGR